MSMLNDPGFGGRILGKKDVAGVFLSETAYAVGARMGAHSHPNAYFCIVRRGAFLEQWKRGSAQHHRDEVIFHPGGDEHANTFLARSRCFNVELSRNYAVPVSERSRIDSKSVALILRRLYSEFRAGAESPLVIEGLIYQALGESFERSSGRAGNSNHWLLKVRHEIAERFSEPLTLTDLSVSAGVHPMHLARAYRREYGTSVGEHVRALRIAYAQQLLGNRSLTLAEIALRAGFSDQSHFSRLFKRSTGVTPRKFRG